MRFGKRFSPGGGGGGEGSVEIPVTGFGTRSDIEKGFKAVSDRFVQLEARGLGADPQELENLKTQFAELVSGQKAYVEEMNKKKAIEGGNVSGPDFASRIAGLHFPYMPDDDIRGVGKEYFNLIGYRADELSFAAQLDAVGSTRLHGLSRGIAGHLRDERNMDSFSRWQRDLQNANDNLYMIDSVLQHVSKEYGLQPREKRMRELKSWKRYERLVDQYHRGIGTASGSAAGQEWLPTMFSAQLHDLVQLQTVVWNLFPSIDMPGKVYTSPLLIGDGTAYLIPENAGDGTGTAIVASQPSTGNMTLTAVKLAARMFASSEATEDLIVPVLPLLLTQLAKVVARALDDATMNGDTSGTHMDNPGSNPPTDAPSAATDRRKAWNGLRAAVINNSGMPLVDISANTDAALISLLSPMGVYAVNPAESVVLASIAGYFKLWSLTDGNSNKLLLRADTLGGIGPLLNGQMGVILGRPVILTEFMPNDTNGTTGIRNSSGGGGTKTQLCVPHLPSFLRGIRRTLTFNASAERHIELDQTVLVSTWRGDFKPWYTLSSNLQKIVALGRNYN